MIRGLHDAHRRPPTQILRVAFAWHSQHGAGFTLDHMIRESDANVAHTCHARSAQKGIILLDPSIDLFVGVVRQYKLQNVGVTETRNILIMRGTWSHANILFGSQWTIWCMESDKRFAWCKVARDSWIWPKLAQQARTIPDAAALELHSSRSGFSRPQSTAFNHCSAHDANSDVSSKEGAVIVSTRNAHRGTSGSSLIDFNHRN
jgi:hypothetical protein